MAESEGKTNPFVEELDSEKDREWKPKAEYMFKILVVGDMAVGKTSLIRRYVNGLFRHDYKSTIGVDFSLKVLKWNRDVLVRIQFWDMAGQERFGNLTKVYFKDAEAALCMFDLTREKTRAGIVKWTNMIGKEHRNGNFPGSYKLPCFLIGNKDDLIKTTEKKREEECQSILDEVCNDEKLSNIQYTKCYHTSCLNDTGINQCIIDLVQQMIQNRIDNKVKPNVVNGEDGGERYITLQVDPDNELIKSERRCCNY